MAFLEHKLNLKVQQKQVLTPSLVQMVNLLALNKLELTDMIQQELVQNPVLEEGTEIVEAPELNTEAPDLTLSRNGTEPSPPEIDEGENSYMEISEREKTVAENVDAKAPEPETDGDPYGDIDFQSFDNYLNDSASRPRDTRYPRSFPWSAAQRMQRAKMRRRCSRAPATGSWRPGRK